MSSTVFIFKRNCVKGKKYLKLLLHFFFQSIQLEMNNRCNDYEATVAMATLDEDKIAKLKEHWDVVWGKILTKKTSVDQALGNSFCLCVYLDPFKACHIIQTGDIR